MFHKRKKPYRDTLLILFLCITLLPCHLVLAGGGGGGKGGSGGDSTTINHITIVNHPGSNSNVAIPQQGGGGNGGNGGDGGNGGHGGNVVAPPPPPPPITTTSTTTQTPTPTAATSTSTRQRTSQETPSHSMDEPEDASEHASDDTSHNNANEENTTTESSSSVQDASGQGENHESEPSASSDEMDIGTERRVVQDDHTPSHVQNNQHQTTQIPSHPSLLQVPARGQWNRALNPVNGQHHSNLKSWQLSQTNVWNTPPDQQPMDPTAVAQTLQSTPSPMWWRRAAARKRKRRRYL